MKQVLALAMLIGASHALPRNKIRLDTSRHLEQWPPQSVASEFCEVLAEEQNSYGDIFCFCEPDDDSDNVIMFCEEVNCEYCSDDYDTCGVASYSANFTNEPNLLDSLNYTFEYTSGIYDDTITFYDSDCDFSTGGSCMSCDAFINGDLCNSCVVCDPFGGGYTVDCENLRVGSSFDYCTGLPITGVFEAVDYYNYDCDYGTPDNDVCSNATMIEETTISGSLFGASSDYGSVPSCFSYSVGSPGVWYDIMGTGNTMILSACNSFNYMDVYISVYTGDCGALECLGGGVDQQLFCSNYYVGGSVSFPTDEGVIYHVLVSSAYGYEDTFSIDISEIISADNESCESALEMELGASVTANLENDFMSYPIGPCGFEDGSSLWYKVGPLEEDTWLQASTCSDLTDIVTGINVMTGDCSDLDCVAFARPFDFNYQCSQGGSRLEWDGFAGATYYIQVTGDDYARGTIDFTVKAVVPPENNACVDAIDVGTVADGVSISGTTEEASITNDENDSFCANYNTVNGGVWYSVVGTGLVIEASTCSPDFGHMISVFTGNCGTLECVATSNYKYCPGFGYSEGARVSWEAQANVTYCVLVRGYYDYGEFELTFAEFVPPENDICESAILIEPNGDVIAGSNALALSDGVPACYSGSTESGGLWFAVNGTGQPFRADTCSELTDFDSEISIYTDCSGSSFSCLGGNDDACGLSR